MSNTYAYIRVSTKRQSYERQENNIKEAFPGESIIYLREKESGKDNSRPEWLKLQKLVKSGDTIIFDSVSRMSRDAEEGCRVYFDLVDRGVSLRFINEPYINSDVYLAKCQDKIQLTGTDEDLIFQGINAYFRKVAERQIVIAFSQAEKEGRDISTRVKQGMASKGTAQKISAARTGKTYVTEKSRKAKDTIRKLSKDFDGNMSDVEVIELTKLARNTYYRYKAQLKEELA